MRWTKLALATKPKGRWLHSACPSPDQRQVLMYGGEDSRYGNELEDLWSFSPDLDPQWKQLGQEGTGPGKRMGHIMGTIGGHLSRLWVCFRQRI